MTKIFKTRERKDPSFVEFNSIELLQRVACDSNAVSHEAGCSLIIAYLENCEIKDGLR